MAGPLTFCLLSTCLSDLWCTVPLQCSLVAEAYLCTHVGVSDWTVYSGATLLK